MDARPEAPADHNLAIADFVARDHLLTLARERGVRFGDRKVFLCSLGIDWRNTDNRRVLLALMHAGDVQLARADLVAAMDPAMVAASLVRTADGSAEFHFLVVS